MKKRNLKSLALNKKSISNLQQEASKGGTVTFTTVVTVITCQWCPTDTCVSTVYEGPVKPTCHNCN